MLLKEQHLENNLLPLSNPYKWISMHLATKRVAVVALAKVILRPTLA